MFTNVNVSLCIVLTVHVTNKACLIVSSLGKALQRTPMCNYATNVHGHMQHWSMASRVEVEKTHLDLTVLGACHALFYSICFTN